MRSYKGLGSAYRLQGQLEKSILCYTKILEVSKEIGDKQEEVASYQNLYTLCNALGKREEAAIYLEKAQEIKNDSGERQQEDQYDERPAQCVYYVCDLYKKSVEPGKYSSGIIDVVRRGRDPIPGESGVQIEMSIKYHEREMQIRRVTGDKRGEGRSYRALGYDYITLGHYKTSIEYFEKALDIGDVIGSKKAKAHSYSGLGNVYLALGQYDKALKYQEESFKIDEEIEDEKGEGASFTNLAGIYRASGQYEKAIEYQNQALEICIEIQDREGEATSYNNLGSIYNALGQYNDSIHFQEKALKIRKEVGDREGEGISYVNLGNVQYALGQHEKAINYLERGLEIFKETGSKGKEHLVLYGLAMSHFHEKSFSKASDYFFGSIKGHESVRKSLKDEDKLSLDDQSISFYKGLTLMLISLGKVDDALCTAERGRARALVDLIFSNFGIQEINKTNEFTLSSLASLLEKQRSDFLFMGIITKQIYLWFMEKSGKINFKIGKELSATEKEGTSLQDLVTTTLKSLPKDDGEEYEDRSLSEIYEDESSKAEGQSEETSQHHFRGNEEEEREANLKKLYQIIIAPFTGLIQGPEIVIIPEGGLFLVPFAALQDSSGKHLSQTYRIRLIPSLTSLQVIQSFPENYHSQTGALIVGDPTVGRVEFDGKVCVLKPLPNARSEADMVCRHVRPPYFKLIGEQATKGEVLKRIQGVGLVHIAAHGDAERGEIALAPNVGATEIVKKEDFMLTMEDIANVGIRAKLVVLSCCNSGHGKVMTAEGVVGIARAFLGSGARSVLMSLWPVNDAATKVFMNVFYRSLMREQKSASEALHLSVKKLRESAIYKHFRHWAAFELLGDDVTFD